MERTPESEHRVQTLRFQFDGSDEAGLLRMRSLVEALCEQALPDRLSELFDDLAGPDEVLEIPRLEIQLGELSSDRLDVDALAEATHQALRNLPPARLKPNAASSANISESDPEYPDQPAPPLRQASSAHRLDQFIGYLLHGDLGATEARSELHELCQALPSPAQVIEQVLVALNASPIAQRRAAMMRWLHLATPELLQALQQRLEQIIFSTAVSEEAASLALEALAPAFSRHTMPLAARAAALLEALWPDQAVNTSPIDVAQANNAPDRTVDDVERAMVLAPHAGVVLLHAFLPQLFGKLELLNDGSFRDESAQMSACLLVHYLASGEPQAAEPLLVVPKLLCGLGPEVPVLDQPPLQPSWRQLADELLEAAIGHWTNLGQASPDGLRETFLKRPGIIKGLPQRPRLLVERRGVDVLLGSMPWALSPIRLPWLPRPIPVDWG